MVFLEWSQLQPRPQTPGFFSWKSSGEEFVTTLAAKNLPLPLNTVNPLLSSPGGLFLSSTFEAGGGLIERGGLKERGGGLINLAKRITSSKNTVVGIFSWHLLPVYQKLSRSRTSWTCAYTIIISAVLIFISWRLKLRISTDRSRVSRGRTCGSRAVYCFV